MTIQWIIFDKTYTYVIASSSTNFCRCPCKYLPHSCYAYLSNTAYPSLLYYYTLQRNTLRCLIYAFHYEYCYDLTVYQVDSDTAVYHTLHFTLRTPEYTRMCDQGDTKRTAPPKDQLSTLVLLINTITYFKSHYYVTCSYNGIITEIGSCIIILIITIRRTYLALLSCANFQYEVLLSQTIVNNDQYIEVFF